MHKLPPKNTRFKPGQSGNPNGRPKKLDDQEMLKTLQQIIKLYSDATAVDKTICYQAHKKLHKLKEILSLC